jgi:RNA polymerase sigma-70 factor (ECF subfamily)
MDYKSLSDDELMCRIQAADKLAIETLVQRYEGKLKGFFYRKNRDLQLAEDLTQDTFIRVLDKSWDFLPSGRFRGWLFRIAYHILIDVVRKGGSDALTKSVRSSAMGEDDLLSRMTDRMLGADALVNQQQFQEIVDKLLAGLPDEQRMTFILHHFEDLSLPEVADAMQSNLPTTKSRLRLGREKLRKQLLDRGIVMPYEVSLDGNDEDSPARTAPRTSTAKV